MLLYYSISNKDTYDVICQTTLFYYFTASYGDKFVMCALQHLMDNNTVLMFHVKCSQYNVDIY